MMKFLYTFFTVILVTVALNSQTIPVTIRVNMGARVYNNLWDPAKDSITIRGDFQVDAGDATNWGGFAFKMAGSLTDTIYSVTIKLPVSRIGTTYNYKYVIGPETWEGADNRLFTLSNTAMELPSYWFNNDSTHNKIPFVTNIFNFYADVSNLIGTSNLLLDSDTDSLLVVGLDWDGHGTVVSGNRKMSSVGKRLYTTTMVVKGMLGDSCGWKFKACPDSRFVNNGYEVGGNRNLPFQKDGAVVDLPVLVPHLFDGPTSTSYVINNFKFNADISPILGSGVGYFDPTQDTLIVSGLDSDSLGIILGGNRVLVADSFVVGLYSTTIKMVGVYGDSCKWKFKANPGSHFINNGYESTDDRWLVFQTAGSSVTLPEIVPSIKYLMPGLTIEKNILFTCKMMTRYPANNAKNGRRIPIDSILWIGVKGAVPALGSWGGNWTEADTAQPNPTMFKLTDDGLKGDKIAGDKVFSTIITFPVGTITGKIEFKYCAFYPAALSDGGEDTPLNNEYPPEFCHNFYLDESRDYVSGYFGDWGFGIKDVKSANVTKFELNQNYPNPFNPTTNIRFTVPVDANVVLKVYNVMGQEVATLVNESVKAGAKEVKFDASGIPSGIYFYKMNAGTYTMTKKMILLK